MNLSGKKILILLGGMYHDFEGFTGAVKPLLERNGCQVEATYDMDSLMSLEDKGIDVVISYTCMTEHREGQDDTGPEMLNEAQLGGLRKFVQAGGGLLAAHAATVLGKSDPSMGDLMGGVFVSHPPQFAFTVYPLYNEHPITAGIDAFGVFDEFYIQQVKPDVQIHMMAVDRGTAYPMVWSRSEGQGKVAHVAMGHSALVWDLPQYQRLMLQAVDWLGN
jgi:type 1 glutamine amidotransferase